MERWILLLVSGLMVVVGVAMGVGLWLTGFYGASAVCTVAVVCGAGTFIQTVRKL